MKKTITTLSLTLAILAVCIYLASLAPEEEGAPQGIPSSIAVERLHGAPPPPAHLPPAPQPVPESDDKAAPPDPLDGRVGFQEVEYEIVVFAHGEPLAGAHAIAAPQFSSIPGRTVFGRFRDVLEYKETPWVVGEDGVRVGSFPYSDQEVIPLESAMCEVAAYHPDHGAAYMEILCSKLAEGEVEVHLERGKTLVGKVVDPEGKPLTNVGVDIATVSWGSVNQNGLSDITDADGRFSISGLRFGNTPLSVCAAFPAKEEPPSMHDCEPVRNNFDEDTQTWDMGVLTLRPFEPSQE